MTDSPRASRDRRVEGAGADLARVQEVLGLCLDEGILSFVTFICYNYRDYPYKREYGSDNDRKPSSKRALNLNSLTWTWLAFTSVRLWLGVCFTTARAANRRFWCVSALRARTEAPYKMDFHRKTRRARNRPEAARTVVLAGEGVVHPREQLVARGGAARRRDVLLVVDPDLQAELPAPFRKPFSMVERGLVTFCNSKSWTKLAAA
jgi:hypothetical protein